MCNYLPNSNVEIKYHGKLLENHALGQRASAIILFILAQKENDIVIICSASPNTGILAFYRRNQIYNEWKTKTA